MTGSCFLSRYGQSLGDSGDLVLSQMAWPSKWIVLVGTLTATIGAGLQALAGKCLYGPKDFIAQSLIIVNCVGQSLSSFQTLKKKT